MDFVCYIYKLWQWNAYIMYRLVMIQYAYIFGRYKTWISDLQISICISNSSLNKHSTNQWIWKNNHECKIWILNSQTQPYDVFWALLVRARDSLTNGGLYWCLFHFYCFSVICETWLCFIWIVNCEFGVPWRGWCDWDIAFCFWHTNFLVFLKAGCLLLFLVLFSRKFLVYVRK